MSNNIKLHAPWKYLIYLQYPLQLIAYHSLILFNPCIKVRSCTFQYVFLSYKILSISSPSLALTCSINWTCKYSVLQMVDLQTFKRWLATPHLILPVLISPLWILNLCLRPAAESIYCLLQHLQVIKEIVFLVLQVKIPLVLYFHLVAQQVNSVETTTKFYKYHIFCYTFQLTNYLLLLF